MTHSLSGAPESSCPYLNNNDRKRGGGNMGSSSRSEDDGPGPGPGPNGGGNAAAAGGAVGANGSNGNHLAVPDSNGNGGSGERGHRPYSPVAETLFRKDLISAMKLPDNEPLAADDYLVVTDTWKQEWEKGVQVPVKPEDLKEPHVSRLKHPPHSANRFQL